MKFIFEHGFDKELFLHDLSEFSNSESKLDVEQLPVDLVNERQSRKINLKDYRKSLVMKKQWRVNRFKLMSGIKRFHRSTKGKQFHRTFGKKVASRDWSSLNESIISPLDKIELLSALSSMRTHLVIGLKFNSSIDEEVNYQLFYESSIEQINDLEKLISESLNLDGKLSLDDEQIEFLRDLIVVSDTERPI